MQIHLVPVRSYIHNRIDYEGYFKKIKRINICNLVFLKFVIPSLTAFVFGFKGCFPFCPVFLFYSLFVIYLCNIL